MRSEIAFNLALIYKTSGAEKLAALITQQYIVIWRSAEGLLKDWTDDTSTVVYLLVWITTRLDTVLYTVQYCGMLVQQME